MTAEQGNFLQTFNWITNNDESLASSYFSIYNPQNKT